MNARVIEDTVGAGNGKRILDRIRAIADNMGAAFEKDGNTKALLLLKDLLKSAVDRETGLRGFLITGQDVFLEPYHLGETGFRSASKAINTVIETAHDRIATRQDTVDLDERYRVWRDEIAEPAIAHRREPGAQATPEAQPADQGDGRWLELVQIVERMRERFDRANNINLQRRLDAVERNLLAQRSGCLSYVASGDERELEPFIVGKENWDTVISAVSDLNDQAYDIRAMKLQIEEMTRLMALWETEVARPEIAARRQMNANPATLEDAARMLQAGTGKRILDRIRGLLDDFIAEAERQQQSHFAKASETARTAELTAGWLGGLQLLLGAVVAWLVSGWISRRIRRLANACRAVADGDFGTRIDVRADDEIGDLADSFNTMATRLEQSIEQTERNAAVLAAQLGALDRSHGRVEFDPTGVVLDVNDAFCASLGYERDDVIGKDHRLFLSHGAESGRESAELWSTLLEGRPEQREINEKAKSGERRALTATFSPVLIHGEGGGVARVVEYFIDNTERRQLEDQLTQSRKLESIGQLAAGVAHEINTPLQCVSANVDFLRKSQAMINEVVGTILAKLMHEESMEPHIRPLRDKIRETRLEHVFEQQSGAINDAASGAQRVAEIVQAMRTISHPGSDNKSAFDLNKVLSDSATVTRNRWMYAAELKLELDPYLPHVMGRHNEISQVAINLIVNAADALAESPKESGELGQITVRSTLQEENVLVQVSDDGPGIPPEIMERVFDPFFTTKEVGKGTGQGLAICYDVVTKRHGGTITVDSVSGRGTTFNVLLPIAGDPSEQAAEEPAVESEASVS